MTIRSRSVLAPLLVLLAACHQARPGDAPVPTHYHTDVCPLPTGVRGYPVTLRVESGSADSAFLQRVVDLAGYDSTYATPTDARHAQGSVRFVLDASGHFRRAELARSSGDRRFDRAMVESARRALTTPTLRFPPARVTGDSLVARMDYGSEPAPGERYTRSSAQSVMPHLRPESRQVAFPAALPGRDVRGAVILMVGIDSAGTVMVDTEERATATDTRLADAARAVTPGLHVSQGFSDCEPIGYAIWMRFDFPGDGTIRVREAQ